MNQAKATRTAATFLITAFAAILPALSQDVPVVPYQDNGPKEPETRTLGAEESAAMLQAEWLFQAEGTPLLKHAAAQIKWTREMAARLSKRKNAPDLGPETSVLAELEKKLEHLPPGATEADQKAIYF